MTVVRIVDAHHHLWDLDAVRYPWLMARGVKRFFGDPAPIQKNYLVADLCADASACELVGSVHIQVGAADGEECAETEWLQKTGDRDGLPTAIVAFADLASAELDGTLDRHAQSDRLRGVRQIVGRSAEEDAVTGSAALLDDPRWYEGLKRLAERDLSFDLQLIPQQMQRAAEVIASVPGLRVALCHCGSPWDQSASGLAHWRAGLAALAAVDGAHCKLSGFGMFDHNWTVESIRPLVETCIDVFGVDRCMFGSNFPVDKLHASYDQLYGAYDSITASLGDAARSRLFVENATAFYRLEIPAS